ncbi:hypothetical protein GCM10010103_66550 [Streptomyces paradoxus]
MVGSVGRVRCAHAKSLGSISRPRRTNGSSRNLPRSAPTLGDHVLASRGPVLEGQHSNDAVTPGCLAQLLVFYLEDVDDPH